MDVCEKAIKAISPSLSALASEKGLDAKLSCREYPAPQNCHDNEHGCQRLGPHVDATFVTLLWSDAPGLQVFDPEEGSAWTGEEVMSVGVPSISVDNLRRQVNERDWANVELASAPGNMKNENAIFLTVGSEWWNNSRAQQLLPVQSPVLHRVFIIEDQNIDRYSLPLLVNLKSVDVGLEVEPLQD